MGCYRPLTAYQSLEPKPNGKSCITFGNPSGDDIPIQLPCGQCIGCRLDRSKAWAIRCMHESKEYEKNCFITLTYDDKHLPPLESLNVEDIQLFFKRLRKKFVPKNPYKKGTKKYEKFKHKHAIRFLQCGEYGETYGRPHHHAVIFNFNFDDLTYAGANNGIPYFNSKTLSKLWGKGFVSVGDFTFETAAYVSRYILKKVNGPDAAFHYMSFDNSTGEATVIQKPEFITMSRNPGLGKHYFEKYVSDMYPHDYVQFKDGSKHRIPKFYDTLFEEQDPVTFAEIKSTRVTNALKHSDNNTSDRLIAREKVKLRQTTKLKRPLPC